MVESIESVRFQGLLNAMEKFHVRRVVEISNRQETFSFVYPFFGKYGGVLSLINDVIARLLAIDLFAFA